jgi:hypothetical protein
MGGSRKVLGDITYSIVRWGIFVVALALLPILISVLGAVTRGDHLGLTTLFEQGELLLVSAAIVGAALADLVTEDGRGFRTLKLTVGGAAALVVIAASAWFADIAAGRRDGSPLDSQSIAVGSLVVFGFAVVAGLSCIVVAELAKKE